MRFFFYGTLIDDDVRALVLGAQAVGLEVAPAELAGWRCVSVRGKTYPAVVRSAAATTPGVLTRELPDGAVAALTAYEGPEYDLIRADVSASGEVSAAAVFVAGSSCRVSARPWDFDAWQRLHKRTFVARLLRGHLV